MAMKTALYTGLRWLEDVSKGETVTKHLLKLRRMKEADPEFIRDDQFKAMTKLVAYAYENSPFYRKRFDEQGVKPGDIKSLDDFSRLKPVTREDVQAHTLEFITKDFKSENLLESHSSGSTGQPITYFQDKVAQSAGRAAVLAGWELAGRRMGDKVVTLWGNRETIENKWSKPGSRFKAYLYRDKRFPVDRLVDENYIRELLGVLVKQRGGYIFGYSHAIAAVAGYVKEQNIELERRFDGVMTTAEKLYPQNRALVEEALGPVYDCYGSREILGIAYQCRERKGYHIIEPNLIFEADDFLDDKKEVVVTDLWNYAWPLIRYKISDLIAGEFGRCSCGCTWKTFDTIVGRATDALKLPDGRLMHPLYWFIDDMAKYWPTFKQVQFARVAEDKVIFRVRLFEGQNYDFMDNMKEAMKTHFAKLGMKFDMEVVESFQIGPSGKHRSIVDETK